ncbi:MAG TPA: ABC transporter permease [Turneriella sp.]|nr:ABC transporter permease [Turneriella sp.]
MLKICGGWLTVLSLIVILTVFLQHLRKGSAKEVLMGQRASRAALKNLKEKSFGTKFNEFVDDLPNLLHWKTLRGTKLIPQITDGLQNTALVSGLSLLFALGIGFIFLITAELHPKTALFLDRFANSINTVPIFLLGIFFIWLFAFALRLLPAGGDQNLRDFILPALSIATKFGARLFLLLKEYMNELERKVFILRARAFGLSRKRIFTHKLLNCLMPFIIFWLIETASLFSGAVIVETLFSIHGLGSLLLFALLQYDIRLIFVNLAVIATIVYATSILQAQLSRFQESAQ